MTNEHYPNRGFRDDGPSRGTADAKSLGETIKSTTASGMVWSLSTRHGNPKPSVPGLPAPSLIDPKRVDPAGPGGRDGAGYDADGSSCTA